MSLNRLSDDLANRLTDGQGNYLCLEESLFSGNFGGRKPQSVRPRTPTREELRSEDLRSLNELIQARERELLSAWDDLATFLLVC